MAYCTDTTEDVFTCMNNYSCHTCPHWSKNKYKNIENEEVEEIDRRKRNLKIQESKERENRNNILREKCKNYSIWCGKLSFLKNCENCDLYEIENN